MPTTDGSIITVSPGTGGRDRRGDLVCEPSSDRCPGLSTDDIQFAAADDRTCTVQSVVVAPCDRRKAAAQDSNSRHDTSIVDSEDDVFIGDIIS